MKDKYLVIAVDGKIYEPREFILRSECPDEFKLVIAREAGNDNFAKKKSPPSPPKYLQLAKHLGFQWEPASDIGFIQYNYKANLIMRIVQSYARDLVHRIGFPVYEMKGSNFFDMSYPVVDAYAKLFGERLFVHNLKEKQLVMSYDASYPQFNVAASMQLQIKDFPFAHFSLSDCYRYEQSGECMLLVRGRRFFMPDLHPYFKDVEQAFSWYSAIEKMIDEAGQLSAHDYWNVIKVSSPENWEKYGKDIKSIVIRRNKPALVEIRQDNIDRYWIIDVDYSIVDAIGQVREIGCIQIDVGNAKRLGIKYSDQNNRGGYPAIIHAAVPGGIERYIYSLLDKGSESFHFGFRPCQIRIIPVNDKFLSKIDRQVRLSKSPLRIEIDDRPDSVSKRVKMAHNDNVGEILVVGSAELSSSRFIRKALDSKLQKQDGVPFMKALWPQLLSVQL